MEKTEISVNLNTKIEEAKKISGLNGRHFGFKNWHASTLNLLRNLPLNYLPDINDFKKLAFEDTKFHRGNRYFSQTDNTKYRKDLESAIVVLKKIANSVKSDKTKIGGTVISKADNATTTAKKSLKKPLPKKQGDAVTASVKSAKKPKTSKDVRSPAKTGRAPGRKRKPKK